MFNLKTSSTEGSLGLMVRASFLGRTNASEQCDHKLPLALLNYF